MSGDDEDIALTIPEAFIYKIPARTSSEGHKAADWPKESVAVVRLQVATKGRDYFLRLYRVDSGKLFAVAPTRFGGPSAVEQVQDSSRYFALRVEDGKGNHAFIGLGLNKREDAFDLKSCLSDIEKSAVAQEKGVDLGIGDISNDLLSGLGTGTNITLKVGKVGSAASSSVSSSGMGSLLRAPGTLAPPGSSGLSVGSAFSGSSSSSGSLLTAPKPAPTKNEWETF